MEASKVYYTDFRCPVGTSLLDKLRRVCIAAGIKDIDMDGKFVAIKMHFGELGNLAFLRPNYAKVVADLCKEQGGLPFLTDCNTLYPGSRKNALEHLTCAQLNGFWPMTTGCQVIIADGLRGTDEAEVPVPNGEYCKTAKIGRAIMDADIFISLTHFKGHESTGFGGTLKNIGMGCGSRAGKMIQHAAGHPEVQQSLCRGCHRCAKECGSDAITYDANNKAVIDQTKCKGCGRCIGACNYDAIYSQCDSANEMLDRKVQMSNRFRIAASRKKNRSAGRACASILCGFVRLMRKQAAPAAYRPPCRRQWTPARSVSSYGAAPPLPRR